MAQKHRKLFFPINSTDCELFPCDAYPEIPPDSELLFPDIPPPPPPPPPLFSSSTTTTLSPYLIISLSIFGAVCVLLTAYIVLAKRCFRRPRQGYDGEQDFLDHNHGPEIDHPIWYINTVGLQSSVINSIAIFKYKKGNNPIKETTCSVCLSEFVEDETLRLLPNCKHAFHIACIDTWLRSHTNCPLCRTLILLNVTHESLEETSSENANSTYNADVSDNLGIANENTREQETEDMSSSKEISYSSAVRLIREKGKRSISVDSLMSVSIGSGSCDFSGDQLHGNLVADRDEKQINVFDNGRTGYNGNLRIVSSSSVMSLHMSPISMKRSFSCSGRLFSSSRYNNKSSSSIIPL